MTNEEMAVAEAWRIVNARIALVLTKLFQDHRPEAHDELLAASAVLERALTPPRTAAEDADLVKWLLWLAEGDEEGVAYEPKAKAAADRIAAIPALIEAEREACAKIVDAGGMGAIARQIRARKESGR